MFLGFSPLIGTPSDAYTSPSAWKPGRSGSKPRSTIASTVRPAHKGGIVAATRNQVVLQAGPQASPTAIGR